MIFESKMPLLGSLIFWGSKPGRIERIIKLLNLIDNPQDKLQYIHVAGTNGKGSTCFTLAYILKEAGYKTGLYTSPEILNFNERIQINNETIYDHELDQLLDFFIPYLNHDIFKNDKITKFELITAMAFKYFSDKKCDIVVLETGLGGKFDATNVIKNPLCSVITSISLDHTQILGNSKIEIAAEKSEIIKPNCPVVLGPSMDEYIHNIIKAKAAILNSRVYVAKTESIQIKNYSLNSGITFNIKNTNYTTGLIGDHQINNLAIVFEVLKVIKNKIHISQQALQNGIAQVKVPCRLEIALNEPLILLDGAHNPAGAEALKQFIKDYLPNKKLTAITGMLADKDAKTTMRTLAPMFEKIFTVTPQNFRALSAQHLTEIVNKYNANVITAYTTKQAIYQALNYIEKDFAIIIFGSFYIMKEAKETIEKLNLC